jgi:hypothetical protein
MEFKEQSEYSGEKNEKLETLNCNTTIKQQKLREKAGEALEKNNNASGTKVEINQWNVKAHECLREMLILRGFSGSKLDAKLNSIDNPGDEWLKYASKTLSGKFSDSPEIYTLWDRAITNIDKNITDDDKKWRIARENFWGLAKNDSSKEAYLLRNMLSSAGFVFRENLSDGTAPILKDHIKGWDINKVQNWIKNDPDREEIAKRLIAGREAGKVPKSDTHDRVLSIDHILARSNGGNLLDGRNLRFMTMRDNEFKGNESE